MMGSRKLLKAIPPLRAKRDAAADAFAGPRISTLVAGVLVAATLFAAPSFAATRQVGPPSDDPVLEGPVPENGGPSPVQPPGTTVPTPPAPPAGADVLTERGAELSPVSVTPTVAEVNRTVSLNGDVPLGTYVVSRISGLPLLQRNNLGYWVPWDGNPDTLIDNHFAPVGDQLTFKILKEDISEQFFPISFIISYRTAAGLKLGVFSVVPK